MAPSHLPTTGNTTLFISDLEELAESDRALRRQEAYGENPAWIRRVLQAYSQTEERKWRQVLRQAARGSRADVPVGIRQPPRLSRAQPRARLPQMATTPVSTAARRIPAASVGTAGPPQPGVLRTIKPQRPSMNLSDILSGVSDVARTYYDIRNMRQRNVYQPVDLPPIMGGGGYRPVSGPVGPFLGGQMGRMARRGRILEGLGGGAIGGGLVEGLGDYFFGDDQMDTMGCKPSDIVYQWDECAQDYVPKKKRKRRRKQLVTKGDIKGLAALKGVVGTGKIMETWIATHG